MSQLKEILQVSANVVDEHGERKREAAHGLDRVTTFSGRKRHMSSPILPIEGNLSLSSTLSPSSTQTPADTSTEQIGAFVAGLAAGESPLDVVASRGGPPPYVLEQVATAGAIHEELREGGQCVRFLTAGDGRTSIELHDRDGNVLRGLSIGEVFDVAAGKPLE
jgi:hypothetical protein